MTKFIDHQGGRDHHQGGCVNEKLTFDAKNAQIFTGSHSGKNGFTDLQSEVCD